MASSIVNFIALSQSQFLEAFNQIVVIFLESNDELVNAASKFAMACTKLIIGSTQLVGSYGRSGVVWRYCSGF